MSTGYTNWSMVLTPPGAGAIGVIRLCGPDAPAILAHLFHPVGQPPQQDGADQDACSRPFQLSAGRLRFGRLASTGEVIDDAIVARASNTEPPAFDIFAHGGVRVIERVLERLEELGAPLVDSDIARSPIWQTRSLLDREAIEALGRAKTRRAVRFLAWQRWGLPAAVEAVARHLPSERHQAQGILKGALRGYEAAKLLIEGATVAIVGPANVGKSTLFNCLAGRPAAVVSARAGTTRDWVTASIEVDGVPLTIVDTAGQSSAETEVDGIAIESGLRIFKEASLALLVLDGSQPWPPSVAQILQTDNQRGHLLVVANKADLPQHCGGATASASCELPKAELVQVSARDGTGIDRLWQRILQVLGCACLEDSSPCVFTARQRIIVEEVISELADSPTKAELWLRERLIGG